MHTGIHRGMDLCRSITTDISDNRKGSRNTFLEPDYFQMQKKKKMHKGGKVQQKKVRFLSQVSIKDLIDVADFVHGLRQDSSLTQFPIIKTKGKAKQK